MCSRRISRADEAEAEDREGRWAWARGWEARPADDLMMEGGMIYINIPYKEFRVT